MPLTQRLGKEDMIDNVISTKRKQRWIEFYEKEHISVINLVNFKEHEHTITFIIPFREFWKYTQRFLVSLQCSYNQRCTVIIVWLSFNKASIPDHLYNVSTVS